MSYFQTIFRIAVFCTAVGSVLHPQWVLGQSSSPQRSVEFPYQAIVRNEGTEIFSGPAAVHYATDQIGSGEIVQVYRHDPGGWCAIRPNPGSFSLIPAAAVEIVADGIGRILQDHTQAWVGTRLGSVEKPLWQIKLKSGEEVEILGEASWPSPDGNSTIWYQISPPAGEFRWVRLSDLNTPPIDTDPIASSNVVPEKTDFVPNSNANVTSSGFTYVDSNASSVLDKSPRPPASVNPAPTNGSGFQYVAAANRVSPVATGQRVKPDSSPLVDPVADTVAGSPAALPTANSWTQSPPDSARTVQRFNATGPLKTEKMVSNDSTSPATVATAFAASSGNTPQRDQQGMDFKFRPIGQTATIAGSFQSSAKPQQQNRDNGVINDPAVSPAAFQSPAAHSVLHGDDRLSENRWQRGRSEIAQLRSQHEARYDQFNQRDSLDHRDVEESFGMRWEDLPDNRPTRGMSYGRRSSDRQTERGEFQRGFQNPSPPYDRYASLNSNFDTIPRSTLAEKLTVRLAKIEQQLTNEMLKRPNEWQLADLELNVGQIYSQTTHPMERLQSQRILDKIKKCKVIRNGYTKNFQATGETFGTSVRSLKDTRDDPFLNGQGVGNISSFSGSATRQSSFGFGSDVSNSATVVGTGIDTDFELNTRFDAVGWLTELVSEDRNNRPVYVLVNDSGEITHHVAGAPGLNLHRYLKSKVGVIGRRGYNNRMKLDHITAEAVDELLRN